MVSGRDSSLRSRLIEFMALFKFVTDTMVKKECTDRSAIFWKDEVRA